MPLGIRQSQIAADSIDSAPAILGFANPVTVTGLATVVTGIILMVSPPAGAVVALAAVAVLLSADTPEGAARGRDDDPEHIFFHGTDKVSAEELAAGAYLKADRAEDLRHSRGKVGFYLATDPDAAQYLASRAAEEVGIVTYRVSDTALDELLSGGATIRPILPGGILGAGVIPGQELYILPGLFPVFNGNLDTGQIQPIGVFTSP